MHLWTRWNASLPSPSRELDSFPDLCRQLSRYLCRIWRSKIPATEVPMKVATKVHGPCARPRRAWRLLSNSSVSIRCSGRSQNPVCGTKSPRVQSELRFSHTGRRPLKLLPMNRRPGRIGTRSTGSAIPTTVYRTADGVEAALPSRTGSWTVCRSCWIRAVRRSFSAR